MQKKSKGSLARFLTGLAFVGAGVMHFVAPKFYKQIMPPELPKHYELIFISGVFEVLGGVALWLPKFRKIGALGLAALLVAVYPANLYHFIKRSDFPAPTNGLAYHLIRLPLQAVMIWWTLRLGRPASAKKD